MANQPVTSAFATSATENEVILSIVQDQLQREVKLPPTVMDMSSSVGKGDKSFDVPKWDTGFAGPADQNPDGLTETEFQSPIFDVDTVAIDQWKTLPYRVPDRVSMQSTINVEAELAKSAGREMGIFVDDRIIARLKAGADGTGALPDHLRGLDGGATAGVGAAITLDALSTCRSLLSRQNLPQSDRYLVIPPEQEKEIIDLDNFKQADKYGSREALLKGEVGEIYGFKVIVHNGLAANEALAYHKSSVAFAMQMNISFESQRADVRIQADDYAFKLGMGDQTMDGGKRNIYLLGA